MTDERNPVLVGRWLVAELEWKESAEFGEN
jgi:hypothetical protein